MPWLLYRYILGELLRIVGLTAAVLVTVIAFGATIKPLTSDILGAAQTAKYLVLAIVPMLQFALPFAAGFGATQALHRMTADNEVQAIAVSGMSYRRMLIPVLALGIALSASMVLLTQWVIPQFWTMLTKTIAMDATKLFQASIRKGEPFQFEKKFQIYAEDLVSKDFPEGTGGPDTRMALSKVAAATLTDAGRIETEITANRAIADVYRRSGRTIIKLLLADAVVFKPESGQLGGSAEIKRTFVLPNPLKDNPKTMTRGELLALRHNPDGYGQVIAAREALATAVRDAQARVSIEDQLQSRGWIELQGEPIGQLGEYRNYRIFADRLRDGQFLLKGGGAIQVLQFEGAAAVRQVQAESARMTPAGAPDSFTSPTFDLDLSNVEVTDLRPFAAHGNEPGTQAGGKPATNRRLRLFIPNLTLANQSGDELATLASAELLGKAATMRDGPEHLKHKIKDLQKEIDSLQREITSRLANRYALSTTACLLLLLGATFAMAMRSSLPLTIYVWAFVPSILDLILISAGEQLMRDGRMLGWFTMWSGNAAMVLLIAAAYFKLARH
jgi:lipopolysaccharide export system permease protein